MEKKTMDTLRDIICEELEGIAKKGISNHEELDMMKDLLDSAKNIEKIEKYQRQKEEAEWSEMDRGYSQRKYYIDADYDPYGPTQSYARGGRPVENRTMYPMRDNSYAMDRRYVDRTGYDGNSYMYWDPMYDTPRYSMATGHDMGMNAMKPEMKGELTQIMAETTDEKTRKAISDALSKM